MKTWLTGFIIFISSANIPAYVTANTQQKQTDNHDVIYWTNAAGAALISLWGAKKWDYGERSFHVENEAWFGKNTYTGGADKLGHVYSSYVLSHVLTWWYSYHGFPADKAAIYGSLSSFGLMTYMEVGDALSDFGFSYEDAIMNGLGSSLGYWLYTHPDLANKLDFRVEYKTNLHEADVFTDYDKLKYLFAIKLSGFSQTRQLGLKYFDLHIGYYTRGYETRHTRKERNLYLGIGINLNELTKRNKVTRPVSGVFNYIQIPDTYFSHDYELE